MSCFPKLINCIPKIHCLGLCPLFRKHSPVSNTFGLAYFVVISSLFVLILQHLLYLSSGPP